jgi:hypothetical protein
LTDLFARVIQTGHHERARDMKTSRVCRGTLFALILAAVVLAAAPAFAAGPFQYHAVTPCRIVDSRTTNPTEGTTSTPLANGVHTFTVQGQCGIPSGAAAVTLNFTIVTPTSSGHLTVWPTGVSEPVVSTLNFNNGEPALANGAIVPLGATTPDLSVRISLDHGPGTSDFLFDVTGYFQ